MGYVIETYVYWHVNVHTQVQVGNYARGRAVGIEDEDDDEADDEERG